MKKPLKQQIAKKEVILSDNQQQLVANAAAPEAGGADGALPAASDLVRPGPAPHTHRVPGPANAFVLQILAVATAAEFTVGLRARKPVQVGRLP